MLEGVAVILAKQLRRIVSNLGAAYSFDAYRVQQLAQEAARRLPRQHGAGPPPLASRVDLTTHVHL